MKKEINEKVLSSWVKMTTVINNDKITCSLPFNEAMICRYLYLNRNKNVIASQLCEWIGIQKSQMNRTLTNMENKNLIHRVRNEEDRRQIFVVLNEEMIEVYRKQHEDVLNIVDRICDELGEDKSKEVIEIFDLISKTAKDVFE